MIEKKTRLEDKKNENLEIFLHAKYIRIVFLRKPLFLYYTCIIFINWVFFSGLLKKIRLFRVYRVILKSRKRRPPSFWNRPKLRKRRIM